MMSQVAVAIVLIAGCIAVYASLVPKLPKPPSQ